MDIHFIYTHCRDLDPRIIILVNIQQIVVFLLLYARQYRMSLVLKVRSQFLLGKDVEIHSFLNLF